MASIEFEKTKYSIVIHYVLKYDNHIQMQYWASDVAGLEETLPPLFDFISRLAKSGERAAANLYGCKKGGVRVNLSNDKLLDFLFFSNEMTKFILNCLP